MFSFQSQTCIPTLAFNYKNLNKSQLNLLPSFLFASIKYDGIRVIWTGTHFLSRNNNIINAPQWFLLSLPTNLILDGELWIGLNNTDFDILNGLIKKSSPIDDDWKKVKFLVFDVYLDLPYYFRYNYLRSWFTYHSNHIYHLSLINQIPIDNCSNKIETFFSSIISLSNEGIMLRNPITSYTFGRSIHLLKLKKEEDAEAYVIGYKLGKGKFQNLLGALICQTIPHQTLFSLSGFTSNLRENYITHFPLNTIITYKHSGFTKSLIPRHPRFKGIRHDSIHNSTS